MWKSKNFGVKNLPWFGKISNVILYQIIVLCCISENRPLWEQRGPILTKTLHNLNVTETSLLWKVIWKILPSDNDCRNICGKMHYFQIKYSYYYYDQIKFKKMWKKKYDLMISCVMGRMFFLYISSERKSKSNFGSGLWHPNRDKYPKMFMLSNNYDRISEKKLWLKMFWFLCLV